MLSEVYERCYVYVLNQRRRSPWGAAGSELVKFRTCPGTGLRGHPLVIAWILTNTILQETRCFVTDGQKLARTLRAAYWAMHRRTNAILAAHGVTADQFVLLSRLADEDKITQQELARRASTDANTIRPMLLLLQKQGMVKRQAHAFDGRAYCIVLTQKGRRSLGAMMAATEECRRQMLSAVKHGSVKGLWRNLAEIAESLESSTAARGRSRPQARGRGARNAQGE